MDEIYTTLPERPVVSPELKRKVLEYLKEHGETWQKVNTIAKDIGFKEDDATKPTIRQACKELLHFDGEPVVSSHAGFTYTLQEGVLRRFKENIESRIAGMRRTVADVDSILSKDGVGGGGDVFTSRDGECGGVPGKQHRFVPYKDGLKCIFCGQVSSK